MCTGLVGACICGHYTTLRWESRCRRSCTLARGRVQRVTFQCSGCDEWEQEVLDVEVESEAAILQTEKTFTRIQSEMERERMAMEGMLWREWYFGSLKPSEKWKKERLLEDEFIKMRRKLIGAQWDAENKIIMAEEAEIGEMRSRWLNKLHGLMVAPEHRQSYQ